MVVTGWQRMVKSQSGEMTGHAGCMFLQGKWKFADRAPRICSGDGKLWKNLLYFCRHTMRKNDFSQA
jgi:hypothetical protein